MLSYVKRRNFGCKDLANPPTKLLMRALLSTCLLLGACSGMHQVDTLASDITVHVFDLRPLDGPPLAEPIFDGRPLLREVPDDPLNADGLVFQLQPGTYRIGLKGSVQADYVLETGNDYALLFYGREAPITQLITLERKQQGDSVHLHLFNLSPARNAIPFQYASPPTAMPMPVADLQYGDRAEAELAIQPGQRAVLIAKGEIDSYYLELDETCRGRSLWAFGVQPAGPVPHLMADTNCSNWYTLPPNTN
jgi:hypothetical protein